MDHFSALYDVERLVADRRPDEKLAARRAHSVGIMDKLQTLLEGFLSIELPSNATWIAANYTFKIYPQLRQFTKDGRVPIDNNALERCWRGVGIGRRNWLFAGSAEGGAWAGTLISISQCCRLVGLDVSTYLQGAFAALHQGRTDYANLRPSVWAKQVQSKVG